MTLTATPEILGPLIDMLRNMRVARGLSQLDVDERAGWSSGLTAKYECGVRVPTVMALRFWANALGGQLAVIPGLPLATVQEFEGRRLPAHKSAAAEWRAA
mgnify:CR=1 FL=1